MLHCRVFLPQTHSLSLHSVSHNLLHPHILHGEKNLISQRLIALRKEQGLSQRDLAQKLQLAGYDMDRNVITRIETNQRYVTDIELKALAEVLDTTYSYLIDGQ